MIDTAGTLVKTAAALMEERRDCSVRVRFARGAFGSGDREHLEIGASSKWWSRTPFPLTRSGERTSRKIKVLSIAGLIGRAIQSIHEETSVSKLFLARRKESNYMATANDRSNEHVWKRNRDPRATRMTRAACAGGQNSRRGLRRGKGFRSRSRSIRERSPHPELGDRAQHDFRSRRSTAARPRP